jgi:hypothetical protein
MTMPTAVFMPIRLKDLILACVVRLPASSTISARNMQTSTSTKSAFDSRKALSLAKPFADLAKAEKRCASYGRESCLRFSCPRFSAPRSVGRCVVPVTAAAQSNRRSPSLVDKGRVSPGTILVAAPLLETPRPAPHLQGRHPSHSVSRFVSVAASEPSSTTFHLRKYQPPYRALVKAMEASQSNGSSGLRGSHLLLRYPGKPDCCVE